MKTAFDNLNWVFSLEELHMHAIIDDVPDAAMTTNRIRTVLAAVAFGCVIENYFPLGGLSNKAAKDTFTAITDAALRLKDPVYQELNPDNVSHDKMETVTTDFLLLSKQLVFEQRDRALRKAALETANTP